MNKRAFTLAEVLVTLGIIGVVAAVLLPALMNNADKNSWTGALKTANSVIPNGFSQMMAIESVNDLWETNLWTDCVATSAGFSSTSENGKCVQQNMKKYFHIASVGDGVPNGVTVYNVSGVDKTSTLSNTIRLTLQNGITFNFKFQRSSTQLSKAECKSKIDLGGTLCGNAAEVYVDVNGAKKPNMIGRDIYGFILSPEGRLYPRGGKDVAIFTDSGTDAAWKTNCAGKKVTDFATTCTDPYELTARVIDEGYQINY